MRLVGRGQNHPTYTACLNIGRVCVVVSGDISKEQNRYGTYHGTYTVAGNVSNIK